MRIAQRSRPVHGGRGRGLNPDSEQEVLVFETPLVRDPDGDDGPAASLNAYLEKYAVRVVTMAFAPNGDLVVVIEEEPIR